MLPSYGSGILNFVPCQEPREGACGLLFQTLACGLGTYCYWICIKAAGYLLSCVIEVTILGF